MSSVVTCTRSWRCEGRGCSRVAEQTGRSTLDLRERPEGWRSLSLEAAFDDGTSESFDLCPDCVARVRALIGSDTVHTTDAGGPYLVRWGYCSEHSEEFATFEAAFAKYAALRSDPEAMRFGGPLMQGAGADGADGGTDGLTRAQRAALGELP